MKNNRLIKYERIWEDYNLFGSGFIDFRIYSGRKHLHWRLFINGNVVSEDEITKWTSVGA